MSRTFAPGTRRSIRTHGGLRHQAPDLAEWADDLLDAVDAGVRIARTVRPADGVRPDPAEHDLVIAEPWTPALVLEPLPLPTWLAA